MYNISKERRREREGIEEKGRGNKMRKSFPGRRNSSSRDPGDKDTVVVRGGLGKKPAILVEKGPAARCQMTKFHSTCG